MTTRTKYTMATGLAALLLLALSVMDSSLPGDTSCKTTTLKVPANLASQTLTKPTLTGLLNSSNMPSLFKPTLVSATRPEMDAYADSKNDRFRVHYDTSGIEAPDLTDNDNNGVPDYVDSTLVYLEHAWQVIVVELGYGVPNNDGVLGGKPRDMLDCYIQELSDGREPVYGLTIADGSSGSMSSYIEIDNGFTEAGTYYTTGYDALKITTAHEFFHMVHYSYFGAEESHWWMEQSAVWIEERIWGDVDDYINYLSQIYTNPNTPLDSTSVMYGASLFAFHIVDKYGENMIRSIWKAMRDTHSGKIEVMNSVLPDGLGTAISDLAVWMYFTNYRANTIDFFKDSDKFTDSSLLIKPEIQKASSSIIDSLDFWHYTFKYVELKPEKGFVPGDSLYFNFMDRDGGVWKNKVIMYNTPYNYEIVELSRTNPAYSVIRPFDKAILVMTNNSERDRIYTYAFSVDTIGAKGVDDEPVPEPFAINQNFPNPFNNSTMIPYTVGENAHVTVEVRNIQGAIVASLIDGTHAPGSYSTHFDAAGLSSGPYFVTLRSGDTRLASKITLIK